VTTSGARAKGPRYVAIIADGNRRWARARDLLVGDGYEAGADTLKARILDAVELGVRELMVYSFSTENWSRPRAEVHQLIAMISRRIAVESPYLNALGVRMRFVGRRGRIPADLLGRMRWAEALTAENCSLSLCVALDYGARAEILDAAARYRGGGENAFRRCLYAPEMHDPELIIRTGGERRLSNYLLWQAAHAELVFRDEQWPDFTRLALQECLAEYAARRGTLVKARSWGALPGRG
jgi:undecaprenyl diphosphate synthase